MCLFPRKIINKKYTATEKNGGCVPTPPIIGYKEDKTPIYDNRVLYVEIPCGNCIECRKKKSRDWQIRLAEELKEWKKPIFITLTFNPTELKKILKENYIQNECNAVCGYAVRHFLERWRKKYKKSLRHWLITELGHENTERIHLHGIIFSNEKISTEELQKIWMYGNIWIGEYCNLKTINYIVKYVTKIDTDHKGFNGQIFASPGLGKTWYDKQDKQRYKYKQNKTIDYYRLETGNKIKLPKYYKNKLYTEEERELIWRDFMNTEKISISGTTYDRNVSNKSLENISSKAKEKNMQLGYGNYDKEWRKKEYNITRQMLIHATADYRKEKADKRRKKAAEALKNDVLNDIFI